MTDAERYSEWLYERMCKPKRAYDSTRLASIAVLEMRKKHPGERFTFYTCAFCGELHVGHPNERPNVIGTKP